MTQYEPYDVCKAVFDNVNSWLLFAEAKNAALLTINAAVAVGLITIVPDIEPEEIWLKSALLTVAGTLLIASVVSFLSFYSRLTPPKKTEAGRKMDQNIWYFGYIASKETEEYVHELDQLLSPSSADRLTQQLIYQICINSRIAVKKYSLFNTALQITFAGIIVGPIGAAIGHWLIQ